MLHGDGRSYEKNVALYLGQAQGTPFELRTSSSGARTGGSDPRKSNPRPDAVEECPSGSSSSQPSIDDLALIADPSRGARADARAAQLASMTRVGGRVILTDPDAEQPPTGGSRPRGNGLK